MISTQPVYNSFFTQRNPLLPKHLLGGVKDHRLMFIVPMEPNSNYHMLPNKYLFLSQT